ncbi:hypothetical protein T492DRAFT_1018672, partial [Pavlovales sp. CCMP2436]
MFQPPPICICPAGTPAPDPTRMPSDAPPCVCIMGSDAQPALCRCAPIAAAPAPPMRPARPPPCCGLHAPPPGGCSGMPLPPPNDGSPVPGESAGVPCAPYGSAPPYRWDGTAVPPGEGCVSLGARAGCSGEVQLRTSVAPSCAPPCERDAPEYPAGAAEHGRAHG